LAQILDIPGIAPFIDLGLIGQIGSFICSATFSFIAAKHLQPLSIKATF
jgi:hypothetical protein